MNVFLHYLCPAMSNGLLCSKEQWIERMNRWGEERKPFIFAIDFKAEKAVCELCGTHENDILYAFPTVSNLGSAAQPLDSLPFTLSKHPVPLADYAVRFTRLMDLMRAGSLTYVNFTCPTRIECNLSLRDIFYRTQAMYRMHVAGLFTVFSPEPFVRIADDTIRSFPMKGTIEAHLPDAEQRILNDPKEVDEHAMAVQMLREDLSRIATQIETVRYRYVERIRTGAKDLLAVSSEVAGHVGADWRSKLGHLLADLLPGASILGYPREFAYQHIESLELGARRFYTGVCGYFDGERLDSAVLIRFIEQTAEGLIYHSGGGVTINSQLEREYQEMLNKVYVPVL